MDDFTRFIKSVTGRSSYTLEERLAAIDERLKYTFDYKPTAPTDLGFLFETCKELIKKIDHRK